MKPLTLYGLCAALFSLPLAAQTNNMDFSRLPRYEPGKAVQNGYTAEDLRDAEIRGKNGEAIGNIEDLIIGPNGQLRRVLVAVNQGFLGIGGRTLAIDFDELQPGPRANGDVKYFTAPVTTQNVEEHGIFKDKQEAGAGKREWRATELIGDYVSVKDSDEYGVVSDLMFDKSGQLRGVAIGPDLHGSVLPFWTAYSGTDQGWDPGDDYYVLPYSTKEIAALLPGKQDEQTRMSSGASDNARR